MLFKRDREYEETYHELRNRGKISDSPAVTTTPTAPTTMATTTATTKSPTTKSPTTKSPSTKSPISPKSAYIFVQLRLLLSNYLRFHYENRDEVGVQLILEQKEIPVKQIPFSIIIHGCHRRVGQASKIQAELYSLIRKKYSITPSVVLRSDYCEDYWKVVFDKVEEVEAMNGKNTDATITGQEIFLQFRRPVTYYIQHPEESHLKMPLLDEDGEAILEQLPSLDDTQEFSRKRKTTTDISRASPNSQETDKKRRIEKRGSEKNNKSDSAKKDKKKNDKEKKEKKDKKEKLVVKEKSPKRAQSPKSTTTPTKKNDVVSPTKFTPSNHNDNVLDRLLTISVEIPFIIEEEPSIRHKKSYSNEEEEILRNLTKIKQKKTHYGSHKGAYNTWIECPVLYDRFPEVTPQLSLSTDKVKWNNNTAYLSKKKK